MLFFLAIHLCFLLRVLQRSLNQYLLDILLF
uniref:Uncharacterized protein n=1 Tax=Podoviridae sp. ctsNK10 TaxID=2826582 RepID=A0A8S5NKT5_9CAUD|nr:MAG TPA: hypothetical protein [Podoviridae sp. ctsNK10]